jgi:hypothetical protein
MIAPVQLTKLSGRLTHRTLRRISSEPKLMQTICKAQKNANAPMNNQYRRRNEKYLADAFEKRSTSGSVMD